MIRFNAGDAEGIAALYHPDAINHQVMFDPVVGREAIRAMFAKEFASADMTCIPERFHELPGQLILEWSDPLGLRGCGFFDIQDGLITAQRGYWDRLSFLTLHNLPIVP